MRRNIVVDNVPGSATPDVIERFGGSIGELNPVGTDPRKTYGLDAWCWPKNHGDVALGLGEVLYQENSVDISSFHHELGNNALCD